MPNFQEDRINKNMVIFGVKEAKTLIDILSELISDEQDIDKVQTFNTEGAVDFWNRFKIVMSKGSLGDKHTLYDSKTGEAFDLTDYDSW